MKLVLLIALFALSFSAVADFDITIKDADDIADDDFINCDFSGVIDSSMDD
jgi:hypothetical protein